MFLPQSAASLSAWTIRKIIFSRFSQWITDWYCLSSNKMYKNSHSIRQSKQTIFLFVDSSWSDCFYFSLPMVSWEFLRENQLDHCNIEWVHRHFERYIEHPQDIEFCFPMVEWLERKTISTDGNKCDGLTWWWWRCGNLSSTNRWFRIGEMKCLREICW